MTGDAVAMMIQRRAADAGYTPAQVDLSGAYPAVQVADRQAASTTDDPALNVKFLLRRSRSQLLVSAG